MSRSDIGVRAAIEADLGAIVAIYAHHVRTGTASFEIDAPDGAEITRRWHEVVDRDLPYLVAVVGSEVVGYAYAAPYRPRPAYRFTVEDSVYVRADFARRGIGAMLLESCEGAAIAAGFRRLEMGATLTGVAFYRAKGYRCAEEIGVAMPNGESLPIVRMWRSVE